MVRLTDRLDMAIAVKPQTLMLKVSYWDQSMSGINNLLEMTTQTTVPILINLTHRMFPMRPSTEVTKTHFDPSKNMVVRGHGQFPLSKKLNIFSETYGQKLKTIWQKWSLGNLIQKQN